MNLGKNISLSHYMMNNKYLSIDFATSSNSNRMDLYNNWTLTVN